LRDISQFRLKRLKRLKTVGPEAMRTDDARARGKREEHLAPETRRRGDLSEVGMFAITVVTTSQG
jgi:hypothetical protein